MSVMFNKTIFELTKSNILVNDLFISIDDQENISTISDLIDFLKTKRQTVNAYELVINQLLLHNN